MSSDPIVARDVLNFLHDASEGASWHELTDLFGASEPRRITQIRKLLRGLERNGEIQKDHAGRYFVVTQAATLTGQVEQRGRQLVIQGLPIENPQRWSLRAGDRVEWVKTGSTPEQPRILDVVAHSEQPLVGQLITTARQAYVQGVGDFKGRVTLTDWPPSDCDHGDMVLVVVSGRDRKFLLGHIVGLIDAENVLELAINTAVANAGLPQQWPETVTTATGKLPSKVQPSRFPHRRDLRELPLVTIDGETAKDFDDAVFAEKLPARRRGWRLVVAIADVAHYVKTGSALDQEAAHRGTSVYFPKQVIPMLPEALSNELCSLKPHTPRLCLVCDMVINQKGEVRDFEFYEGVMYSHARLTYNEVQKYNDGDPAPLPIEPGSEQAVQASLAALNEVYTLLRGAREKRGALDFPTREAALSVDHGQVVAISQVQRITAHQLIEEAMIAANVCSARFLEQHDALSLYRVHEPPEAGKVEELRQALMGVGVTLPKGSVEPKQMQHALQNLPDSANGWIYAQLALRSLQQAIYTPNNQGHFGLALERYMHFTSPIRRYPDLLVHRAIKQVLADQAGTNKKLRPPTGDELHWLGEQCSDYERRAESAAWMVEGWLKCEYLKRELGNTVSGIVAGVTEFGLFVEIDGYYVQGLVHISGLGTDYFHFYPKKMALVGEKSGRQFALGDRIEVVVADIEPAQGKIDLQLVSGGSQRGGKHRGGKGKAPSKDRAAGKRSDKHRGPPKKRRSRRK